jgi:NodT family efflux transporter outer membrane factor (OMF) lipoprotein
MRIFPTLLLTACLMSSCALFPEYRKPEAQLPDSWASARPPKSDLKDLATWWNTFQDPQLNSLIQQALVYNPDMRIALERVREARDSAKIAKASLYPQADASFGADRGSTAGLSSSSSSTFRLAGTATWELDVFGGNRYSVDAAMASLASTSANTVAVMTSLCGEVATSYFSWISAAEELRVARQQLELQRRTLDIVTKRKDSGFASGLDWEQSRSQVAQTEASIPRMEASMKLAENTLSVLLGTYLKNTKLTMPSPTVYNRMPTVPVGVPSDLLRRRPDVIAAEMDFYAATANVGVAVANLYPKFSLTGSLSSGASKFEDVFLNKNAGWSLGANITQPLFHAGELRARVDAERSAAIRSEETYRKTLISAVSEVEQALINYASYKQQLARMEVANESNKKAAEISLKLYTAGETDFLNVVTAQTSWLQSEESIVTLRQNIRQSVVQLAIALGGGW